MRRSSRASPLLLALVAAVLGALGCSRARRASSPPAAGPSAGPDTVVAEVAGQRITLSELDRRAAGRRQRLAQEEYEIRREALDELVAERLLDREAAARGIGREALMKAEVTDKLTPVSPDKVRSIYERSREALGGRPFEEVRPHIERTLAGQARAEREAAFQKQLRSAANVRVALEPPRAQVAIPADAPRLGPDTAAVTLVEFLDYQCPYCHKAQEVVDRVLEQYPGKVRFVHRDFLLGRPRSLPAARAARCAGEQGRFWEYHRSLLTQTGDLSDKDLRARARGFGLDTSRFDACVASGRYDATIQQAVGQGQDLGITGTPTFFVNGRRVVGVRPLEEFRDLIDSELRGGNAS